MLFCVLHIWLFWIDHTRYYLLHLWNLTIIWNLKILIHGYFNMYRLFENKEMQMNRNAWWGKKGIYIELDNFDWTIMRVYFVLWKWVCQSLGCDMKASGDIRQMSFINLLGIPEILLFPNVIPATLSAVEF